MAKLYFKYGAMGCGKSAQALLAGNNYERKGFNVLYVIPKLDVRSNGKIVSRINLSRPAKAIDSDNAEELKAVIDSWIESSNKSNLCIIVDEVQFFSEECIDVLKTYTISEQVEIPILCYGLLTDFKLELFSGSKRLIELADSLMEIKSICKCGRKATVNARFDENGNLVTAGEQIVIGDTTYEGLCYKCYQNQLRRS